MSGNTGQHITVETVVWLPAFLRFRTLHILSKSALALISAPVIHSSQARKCFSPICCSRKFIEIYVEISPGFCYNIDVSLCPCVGVKNPRWQADT